mmetsp:Transcript_17005/g.41492  ORF Transcript_17005/g.41492 Transcript_17005/m.41492 type:complete len:255 (+) Transcript_17005:1975-2739(+)
MVHVKSQQYRWRQHKLAEPALPKGLHFYAHAIPVYAIYGQIHEVKAVEHVLRDNRPWHRKSPENSKQLTVGGDEVERARVIRYSIEHHRPEDDLNQDDGEEPCCPNKWYAVQETARIAISLERAPPTDVACAANDAPVPSCAVKVCCVVLLVQIWAQYTFFRVGFRTPDRALRNVDVDSSRRELIQHAGPLHHLTVPVQAHFLSLLHVDVGVPQAHSTKIPVRAGSKEGLASLNTLHNGCVTHVCNRVLCPKRT